MPSKYHVAPEQCGAAVATHPLVNCTPPECCRYVHDTFICWPPTKAGHNITLPCPSKSIFEPTCKCSLHRIHLLLTTNCTAVNITRQCHSSGQWMGKPDENGTALPVANNAAGYSPYLEQCMEKGGVSVLMRETLPTQTIQRFHEAQLFAAFVRRVELVGLTCSFVALSLACFIFLRFRCVCMQLTTIIPQYAGDYGCFARNCICTSCLAFCSASPCVSLFTSTRSSTPLATRAPT